MTGGRDRSWLAALPLFGWLLWLLVAPLAIVVVYSFLVRGPYGNLVWTPTVANYGRLFDGLYLSIYGASLKMALAASLVCLVIGYPMALVMARARPALKGALFLLLMVPFLSNFVVRAFAIKVLLSQGGPISQALVGLGVVAAPVSLGDGPLAVWIGMITNYLPFMVLPLYVALDRFDFTLVDAAYDLGAGDWSVLTRVLLPLTRVGIASGFMLVFVPTLGEFMIPDLLGGARTMLLGNLITEQFLKARDWPFGAALVVGLGGIMLLGFAAHKRLAAGATR